MSHIGSAVVIGIGNIGSFAANLVARLGLQRLLLIDRDRFEAKNLLSQDICSDDIGLPKAVAAARRLREVMPGLQVEAVVDDVENVPLGSLRADVILACVDSRRARQAIGQRAWRLGVPLVDSGVHADGLLARVNVYMPQHADACCVECGFDARDYELLEQAYVCAGGQVSAPATNAPAALGALSAALQVIECRKLLFGDLEHLAVGKQIVLDAMWQKHMVSRVMRLLGCRFDHQVWQIDHVNRTPSQLTLRDVFALGDQGAVLGVEGQQFTRRLTCPVCGETSEFAWRLSGRLAAAGDCPVCKRRMLAAGFDACAWLVAADLDDETLRRPLSEFGFLPGDVVSLRTAARECHLELGGLVPSRADCAGHVGPLDHSNTAGTAGPTDMSDLRGGA